jgi:hypothetical protein
MFLDRAPIGVLLEPQEGNRNPFKAQTHFHWLFIGFSRLIESCASAMEQRLAEEPFVERNNKRNWHFHENFFSSLVRPAFLRKTAVKKFFFPLAVDSAELDEQTEITQIGRKSRGKVKQNVVAVNCLCQRL